MFHRAITKNKSGTFLRTAVLRVIQPQRWTGE